MIKAQHQRFPQQHPQPPMTDTISQPQESNTTTTTSTSTVAMNGDTKARRDAASMMMSMSHLMDAAALHAQQQQNPSATSAGSLPAVNTIHNQVLSHHNHTSRGPHKKRTASNAALDDTHSNSRVHSSHLINGGGVLRMPMTESTAAVSSSSTAPTTSGVGKGKTTSASSNASGTSTSNATTNAPLTEEEKKAERRAANRRSAFQSRQRRKILIEDLQRTVAALSKDNNDLRKNNDEIRTQLEAALLENRQLRQITSSLSAQARAQVAVQQAHQQAAPGSQQQTSSSPSLSAQVPPPIPSLSQQQQQPPSVAVSSAAPPPFPPQSLTSPTAALTSFLNSFSSQAASATPSSEQRQQIFNAKIALMAAQSRVNELEHHHAAQAQAAASAAVVQQQQHQAQLQAQAQVAASAALGLAHVQASTPGATSLSDAQHLARLQELLARGITGAAAATPVTAPPPVAPTVALTSTGAPASSSISAAGVDLSHLRSLLEAQQQQQQAVGATGPISTASESSAKDSDGTRTKSGPGEAAASTASATTATVAPQASSSLSPAANTASSDPITCPTNLAAPASTDAPGIQLLIESLRAGQNGNSGNRSTPPLDEAVRNFIKQQQLAQAQQTSNGATAIKTEAK